MDLPATRFAGVTSHKQNMILNKAVGLAKIAKSSVFRLINRSSWQKAGARQHEETENDRTS